MYGMNVMYVMTNMNAENSQLNFTSTEIILSVTYYLDQ